MSQLNKQCDEQMASQALGDESDGRDLGQMKSQMDARGNRLKQRRSGSKMEEARSKMQDGRCKKQDARCKRQEERPVAWAEKRSDIPCPQRALKESGPY